MKSLWKQTALPSFPALAQDIRTDVLIIGGGLAGLLCAYRLEREGADYVLIESDRLCGGVSGNTTAKVTAQHGLIYHKLLSKFGPETARSYYRVNQAALEEYARLAEKIDCDFTWKNSYVCNSDAPRQLEKERRALEQLEIPHSLATDRPVPGRAICFPRQAQFHPLKFAAGIAPGLRIYEHTPARDIQPGAVFTDVHTIRAERVVVATHFPVWNRWGGFFLKLYQQRSYVLALENCPDPGGMYLDEGKQGVSLRSQGNVLLLGGGGHRTGKQGGGFEALTDYAAKRFPDAREVARWAAQDCMSLDGIPYIGRYSPRRPDLFVATGFQKWGMTTSMVSARLLTEALMGREDPDGRIFDPARSILCPQLAVNAAESVVGLLTPRAPRCTHLGCALKWNPQEHSWDCGCHGSRFDENGHLLENPAQRDLKQ